MTGYTTKQRKILLSYLSEHKDEQFTAKQIACDLADSGISLSAVYRNLTALESENKVKRTSKGGSRDIYYRYTAAAECRDSFHLCCQKCGKTFHMENEDADRLVSSVKSSSSFELDKSETVLYGVCKACKSADLK